MRIGQLVSLKNQRKALGKEAFKELVEKQKLEDKQAVRMFSDWQEKEERRLLETFKYDK